MDTIELGLGRVDLGGQRLMLQEGGERSLTEQDVHLLRYLAQRPGEDVPREDLLTGVMGYAPGVLSRAVDDAIKRLRAKIERVPARPFHLVGVRGVGYRFVPLRRAARTLSLGEARVDLERLEVIRDGVEPVALSAAEGRILEVLAQRSGQPVSHGRLLRDVWQIRDLGRKRLVDKALYRLRAKIEPDPRNPRWLKTVRGRGFVLELPVSEPEPTGGVRCRVPATEVVGREALLAEVEGALASGVRVVTLVGPRGWASRRWRSRWGGVGAPTSPICSARPTVRRWQRPCAPPSVWMWRELSAWAASSGSWRPRRSHCWWSRTGRGQQSWRGCWGSCAVRCPGCSSW